MTIAFAVGGPIARADLPGLCDRICALFDGRGAAVAWCDVPACRRRGDGRRARAAAAGRPADGCSMRLRNASPELRELVAFMGLSDVVG